MIAKRNVKVGVRYEVRLRGPDGRERSKTFRTRREAETYERAQRTDMARGAWLDPSTAQLTFAEVADRWERSNPAKRSSAAARDESVMRVHLLPALGAKRVASITPTEVQGLVNRWATHAAAATVRRQYGVLRAILNYAVAADLLGRSPARGIRLPAVERAPRRQLGADELAALAQALGDDAPMVWLGGVLGLRWGEMAGLRVGAVDFLAGTLSVRLQRTRGRGGVMVEGPPKSDAGRRTMSVPQPLLDVLAAHLARRGLTAADEDAYVFTAPEGGPLDYTHWRRRVWLPAVAAAGLDGVTPHDLRRAAATALVAERVDLKVAQSRLGHADVRMTVGIYAAATGAAEPGRCGRRRGPPHGPDFDPDAGYSRDGRRIGLAPAPRDRPLTSGNGWSGRRDSNPRPQRPERCALTKLRHFPVGRRGYPRVGLPRPVGARVGSS